MSLQRIKDVISKLVENGAIDDLDALLALKQIGFNDAEIFCICPDVLSKYQRIKTLDEIRQAGSEDDWLRDLAKRNGNPDLIRPSDIDAWIKERDAIVPQEQTNAEIFADTMQKIDQLGIYRNMELVDLERQRLGLLDIRRWQLVQRFNRQPLAVSAEQIKASNDLLNDLPVEQRISGDSYANMSLDHALELHPKNFKEWCKAQEVKRNSGGDDFIVEH